MTTKSAITSTERNLLLRDLIIWLILTGGMSTFIIYSLVRILNNVTNDEAWIYVFIFSVVSIVMSIRTIKLFLDYSSKEINEGQSEITDAGRELSSTFNRYIRLLSFGKKKIRIQYPDRDKMRIGDTIKFRIAPKSKMLLSFEVGVATENKGVLFPPKEVTEQKSVAATSQRLSIKQLVIYSLVFGLAGGLLFWSVPAFISCACIMLGVYVTLIGEIPGIINGYKARLIGLGILIFGFFLFTEVAIPLLK